MAFTKNWFSNFIPFETPLVYQGVSYPTSEHFYQAMKAPKNNISARKSVAEASTPGRAKRAGRKVDLRPDWENIKEDVMEYALRHKFQEGTKWRAQLMATKGEIVEWNNWHDRIWGKCTCARCGSQGQNLLGKLLMKLKKEFSCC